MSHDTIAGLCTTYVVGAAVGFIAWGTLSVPIERWPLFTFGWPLGILVIVLMAFKQAWMAAKRVFS
jgi:hypothetical protein